MANVSQILQNIVDAVLTGGRRTTAVNVRALLKSIAESYANFQTGGKSFEAEVGYKDDFRPTTEGAFATVDMLADATSSEITDEAVIALLEDPEDNWTENVYTGSTPITGYKSGDFYINDTHDYKVYAEGTKIRRIPYQYL